MTTPLSIEAFPLVVTAHSGGSVHYDVTVRDAGTKPVNVTATTARLGGACNKLTFTPSHFALKPQQQQVVTVTAPSGQTEDYLSEFTGTVQGSSGINVSAAVGTRLIVGHPSSHATCTVHASAPVSQSPASFPLWAITVIAAALLTVVVIGIRRLRHGHS